MRSAFAALLTAGLLACAAPAPLAPAAVRVDVVRTPPLVLAWEPSGPPPIHVLLDVTSSMGAASTEGVTYLEAARHAAERFLHALPPNAEVTLHVLGTAIGSACTSPVPVSALPGNSPGEGLAPIARALPSRSEGSLGSALVAIARRLNSGAGARFVAISDLEESCAEVDLCEAAAVLHSAGAELDLVVIGEAPIPSCLPRVEGDQEPPLFVPATAPTRASFRVVDASPGSEAPLPAVGVVGGAAVEVPPGRFRVGVDLDPPVEVGPVDLASNASLRIRILELPAEESQRWRVFVDGASATDAAGSVP